MPRIDQFAALDPYRDKLARLGYTTVEQFVGAANGAALALANYLGVPDLTGLLATLPSPAADPALAALSCQLSSALAPPTRPLALTKFEAALAPPAVDHVNLIPPGGNGAWPVLNQGTRETCVAFAAAACLEAYLREQTHAAAPPMSEQFLYWDCKRRDGAPNSPNTWLSVAFDVLQYDGCAPATAWGYVETPVTGNESQDPPPGGAAAILAIAARCRISGGQPLATNTPDQIKAALAGRRAVAINVAAYASWNNQLSATRRTGEILLPVPGEQSTEDHALCVVGYRDDATAPGGGRFIVRNSWSTTWGNACPYGPGYGTMPYGYPLKQAYVIAAANPAVA